MFPTNPFLKKSLFTAAAPAAACLTLALAASAQTTPSPGGQMVPLRPPAAPLIVRSPYVSAWQNVDALDGQAPTFWAGRPKSITGIARVDGHAFVFLGDPRLGSAPAAPPMTQTSLYVTPTQSVYRLTGGGVTVTVDFLSPVEPSDLRRLSVPFGYVFATARSADGRQHAVSLYFDMSGEWAHGDENAPITWERRPVPSAVQAVTAFAVTPAAPKVLGETNEYPMWGTAVFATADRPGLTTQAGQDSVIRAAAISSGVLDNTVDQDQPRAINSRNPVFAFNFDLGQVGNADVRPVVLALGDSRDPAVSYQKRPVPPLWRSYWPAWPQMMAAFYDDAAVARARADALDKRVNDDATRAGGAKYAALCSLALRQAFGATEMVGTADNPWMFMKEISSDGNISTVDIMYPAFPAFLYADPRLVRMQLAPLFDYVEAGHWPQPFAPHDIGASYPNADGHNDGGGENMPVEESANMLIMAAAYMRYVPKAEAAPYARAHYRALKQWADYLLTVPTGGTSPNALDPLYQNQTDDFTGSIAHSVNLALKGVLGVGAMGQIAGYAGNKADAAHYGKAGRDLIAEWARRSQSQTGPHLTMQYIEADTPRPTNWGAGIVGPHALLLSSVGGADAARPAVDTTKSYTVSAWVKLNKVEGYQTFVGIDGAHVSGFFLQLRGGERKFSLTALAQDSDTPGMGASATALAPPIPNIWYHLAGVYDADLKTLSLYVNGVLQNTVPYTAAFRANGHTSLGRGFFNGGQVDFVNGALDDVRFYQAVLPAADVLALAQPGASPIAPAPIAHWTFDEGTGKVAADSSGGGNDAALGRGTAPPDAAWSLKYNAFPDKVLGLNLVPESVLREEAAFYKTQLGPFGVPLDIRHSYTKVDWELWTAASTDDRALRQGFVDGIYNFADTSHSRVPFSDWYDTATGQQQGFQARPAIGGVFAILDRTALKVGR